MSADFKESNDSFRNYEEQRSTVRKLVVCLEKNKSKSKTRKTQSKKTSKRMGECQKQKPIWPHL